MDAVAQLSLTVGVESACNGLGVARASFYRRRPPLGPPLSGSIPRPGARPASPRALSSAERDGVLAVLHYERFQDCAPADLSVTKTRSRPYTSNDNPYSESQFRTMKYRPEFPDRFGCIQAGLAFCQTFFPWFKDEHHHSGTGMMTPAMVH